MTIEGVKKHEAALFPVLDVLLNGLNFAFHFITAQHIGSGDYGILSALLALFTILSVMGTSCQTFLAGKAARDGKTTGISELATIFGIFPGLLVFLSSGLVAVITNSSFESALLLALMFMLHFITGILRGTLQGNGRFLQLNISFYLEVGIKIATIFVFLPLFPVTNTALIAICLGYTGAIFHGIFVQISPKMVEKLRFSSIVSNLTHNLSFTTLLSPKSKEVASIVLVQLCMFLFTALDMIVVNYQHPGQSGIFAAVQKYSLVPLFVTASITTVMIPQLSALIKTPEAFITRWSKYAILILSLAALYIAASFTLLPHTVSFVFTIQYAEAAQYLGTASLASTLLLIVHFLTTTLIIVKSKIFIPVLLGTAVLLIPGFFIFGTSLYGMYHTEIAVYLLLSAALAFICKKEIYNEK